MKKTILFLIVLFVFFSCDFEPNSAQKAQSASVQNADTAINSTPTPTLSYFQERRTIDKWVKYWDKPSLPTYVYLWVFDKCIGYYVADGKPASTRSYLTPETQWRYLNAVVGTVEVQAPDIDGTYGDNNPGIRFFTATGIPVEFGGAGASYLYSAVPLPIDVPKLEMK